MLRTPNWSAPRSEWSADRMSTQGTCEPRFERVREEFERNFAERGEVGASVCVTLDGQTVVDLWGGTARPDQPWAQDTIGKDGILVRHLLSHQAGLPAVREPLPAGCFYNWQLMVDALAREEPFWRPGTRNGYHGLTFGFLVGEVIRRVSGRTFGTYFRDEVAGPLGLDFWIGLPEEHEERVAPTIPADPPGPGDPVSSL